MSPVDQEKMNYSLIITLIVIVKGVKENLQILLLLQTQLHLPHLHPLALQVQKLLILKVPKLPQREQIVSLNQKLNLNRQQRQYQIVVLQVQPQQPQQRQQQRLQARLLISSQSLIE